MPNGKGRGKEHLASGAKCKIASLEVPPPSNPALGPLQKRKKSNKVIRLQNHFSPSFFSLSFSFHFLPTQNSKFVPRAHTALSLEKRQRRQKLLFRLAGADRRKRKEERGKKKSIQSVTHLSGPPSRDNIITEGFPTLISHRDHVLHFPYASAQQWFRIKSKFLSFVCTSFTTMVMYSSSFSSVSNWPLHLLLSLSFFSPPPPKEIHHTVCFSPFPSSSSNWGEILPSSYFLEGGHIARGRTRGRWSRGHFHRKKRREGISHSQGA